MEDARAGGLDVTWDTYPSEWAEHALLIMLPHVGPGRRPRCDAGAPGDRARSRERIRDEMAVLARAYAGRTP